MNIEIINEIKKNIDKDMIDIENDKPYFSDKRYKAFKIEKNNFHPISEKDSGKKIAFVDGGNAEIIKTANFSLQLIRVYYTIYQNNNRISSKREEFFMLTSIVNDKKISYKSTIFGNDLIDRNDLLFDLYDKTLKEGNHQVEIAKIGETARRFAELKLTEKIISDLDNSIIVIDGSLQSTITNENKYLESLYKKALEKNIAVAGLSKTTTLITEKGNSLTYVLNRLAPKGKWYYCPVVDISNPSHQAEMFFVKLNENSNHIFRFELYKQENLKNKLYEQKQKFDINEILGILAINSKDPIFFGYPYGLIEADKFARIANAEKEYWRTIIASKLKFDGKGAHEILDRVN